MALGRTIPRRARARRDRRSGRTAAFLFRQRQRRRLAERRCRADLGADLRSVNVGSIGAIAVAPSDAEADLRRHRRSRHAFGHRPGRSACSGRPTAAGAGQRSASTDTQQIGRILVDPRNPDNVYRRGARPSVRPERGARRVPLDRRRQTLDKTCSRTPTPARSTWRSSPAIRTWSMPPCGRRGDRRGTPTRRRAGPAAASTSRPMAARTWRQLAGHGLPTAAGPDRPRHQSRASRGRVYALVDSAAHGGRRGRPLSLRRSRARPGPRSRATSESGTAAGISAGSPPIPKNADRVWTREHDPAPLGRRRRAFHAAQGRSDRRRFPQPVGRPEESRAAHPRRRPGDAGHAQRRQDVEQLVQPADRPVLPRLDRQPLPLPGLRIAAGFRRRRRAEPERQPTTAST